MLRLSPTLESSIQRDASLARFTAARLGGPADYLYLARESMDEVAELAAAAWRTDLPLCILGGGANVLVSDRGVRGLVIINHVDQVVFEPNHLVKAASGVGLSTLARRCAGRGLSGLEWAVSVPGTVGGAAINNAGAHGSDMAANVVEVQVGTPIYDAAGQRGDRLATAVLRPPDLTYGYRTSALKTRTDRRFVVTEVAFQLAPDEPQVIEARMDANIAHRKRTQPPGASLGSIFKNPPGDYAGRLIEGCGLKGFGIGGAQVSPLHANFFINTGSASADDYAALIHHVRSVVVAQTGVLLEMEIEFVGDWS